MNFDLTPDQEQLQARVRDFAQAEVAPIAEKLDRDGVFPTELFKKLGDLGVMSIPFDEKHGGMGLGVFEAVLAIEEVARADQSLAVSAMVSMATGLTLARFGSEQLIDKWLPEIVTGQKMCAIAGTEPNAGSDTAGFKTRARMVGNDRWSINGEKAFITNAGTDLSIFTLLLTVSSPPDAREEAVHAVPGARTTPRATPAARSIASSAGARPIRVRSISTIAMSTATMSSASAHKGRWILHKGYQAARLFLAACSLGLAQASLDHSIKYAQERQAFGGSLGRLQLIQEMIADMALRGRYRPARRPIAPRGASTRAATISRSCRWRSISPPRPAPNAPISRSRCTAAGATWMTARCRATTAITACAPSATAARRSRSS